MHQAYTSKLLHHFVGRANPSDDASNFKKLLLVLNARAISFGPDYPSTFQFRYTFNWNTDEILRGELVVPQVTCYADIPTECLGIHVGKYGRFGLSFKRKFIVKNGGRPVFYIPLQSSDRMSGFGSIFTELMVSDWLAKWQAFHEHVVTPRQQALFKTTMGKKPESENDAILAMDSIMRQEFFGFLKVFDSDLSTDDPNNFYMEREWRIANPLPFAITDVVGVFLPEAFIDEFRAAAPDFQGTITKLVAT